MLVSSWLNHNNHENLYNHIWYNLFIVKKTYFTNLIYRIRVDVYSYVNVMLVVNPLMLALALPLLVVEQGRGGDNVSTVQGDGGDRDGEAAEGGENRLRR
jgi:hypothetical protein